MKSRITGGDTSYLFSKDILNKYEVKYFRCNTTGFIQTEEPYWLPEAYSSAITKLDLGLPSRNITLADRISKLLITKFDYSRTFLDYAGGYGLFTRLMRDKGFNFYHTDKYCQNLFAEYFDLVDLPPDTNFELVTAFEVLEHLSNPIEEINVISGYSDNVIFTTELQPKKLNDIRRWSYIAPETGQHIAFYNMESLAYIAKKLSYNFYTDGEFLHLFSKQVFDNKILKPVRDNFLLRKAKKFVKKAEEEKYGKMDSLLMKDWQYVKEKLNKVETQYFASKEG
jgi:hypothetical protein